MNNNKFSFFAPAYLCKSGSGNQTSIKIGGVISTEERDADGEIVLTKGLDFGYFDGGWGKIKYEHDSPLSKEPDNIIGFPTKLVKSNKSVSFEGELIPFDESTPDELLTPQQKSAKSAYGLLKAIEEHNEKNPHKPQKVGYSIEGEYLQRDRKTGIVQKARITNVVLTTKPKNTTTLATLMKSLQVGYGMTPETQTGFGATREESVAGNVKSQISQEGERQMTFKSKEEAKKYFLSQGLSEEEAEKKATEAVPDVAEKSVSASKDYFEKSIETAKEVEVIQPDINPEALTKSLTKSLQSMQSGDKVDLSDYFVAKQETDLSVLEAVSVMLEKQDLLAKSLLSLASGLLAKGKEDESLTKAIGYVAESQKINNQALLKSLGIQQSKTFAPSDVIFNRNILNNAEFDENSKPTEGEVDLNKMSKAVVSNAIFELYKEGKATTLDVSKYEGTRLIDENLVPLVKAKVSNFSK